MRDANPVHARRRRPAAVAAAVALVVACLAGGAPAEEPPAPVDAPKPGAVSDVALAQELHAVALARGDAVLALAAARVALSVALTETERPPRIDGAPPEVHPPGPPSVRDIVATARALAGEDVTLAGLVDEAEAEAMAPPATAVSASRAALAPTGQAVWEVAFFGGATAEVAVLAGGALTLDVADAAGAAVCAAAAPAAVSVCRFIPKDNAGFTITVANPGPAPVALLLLTN